MTIRLEILANFFFTFNYLSSSKIFLIFFIFFDYTVLPRQKCFFSQKFYFFENVRLTICKKKSKKTLLIFLSCMIIKLVKGEVVKK